MCINGINKIYTSYGSLKHTSWKYIFPSLTVILTEALIFDIQYSMPMYGVGLGEGLNSVTQFFKKSIKIFLYQLENYCIFVSLFLLLINYNKSIKKSAKIVRCITWWILKKWTHRRYQHLDQETERDQHSKNTHYSIFRALATEG